MLGYLHIPVYTVAKLRSIIGAGSQTSGRGHRRIKEGATSTHRVHKMNLLCFD